MSTKFKTISVRFTAEVAEAIDRLARLETERTGLPVDRSGIVRRALEQDLARREAEKTPYQIGAQLAREGLGISDIWGAVKRDSDMAEAQRGYDETMAEQKKGGAK